MGGWFEGSGWSIGSMLIQLIIANLMKIFYILKRVCFISYIYEVSQKVHKIFYKHESTSFVLSFFIHVFNWFDVGNLHVKRLVLLSTHFWSRN